jgi:endonuclease-3
MPRQAAAPKPMTRVQIARFFDVLAARIVPESELQWQTPLDLTIAVVLSAQCTDKAVNKATAGFFPILRTPADYVAFGEERFREAIKSIGLFRNKAKNVIGLCRMLIDEFDGEVPRTREELQRLPGVGRKTANVVLNVVFGEATLAVDTHIQRVANRIGMVRAKTPDATEQALLKKIPAKHLRHAHHYLILHGRYTCKARKPDCPACPVREFCNARDKTPG